jgi:hypothetical protein
VQFSNHTGYGDWTGQVYTGDAVRDLVDGIAARDALRHCDAVLAGYMGDAGIGEAILHAVTRVREVNPRAIYCCDPVIGDVEEGVYVREASRNSCATMRCRRPTSPRRTVRAGTPDRLDCGTLAGCQGGGRRAWPPRCVPTACAACC